MGYRSEVVLAIAPEAAPAFMAMCAKYPKVNAFCFRDADYKASGHEEEGDWIFKWDSIKWYVSYEEISEVESFMRAMEDGDLSVYGEKGQPKGDHDNSIWDEHYKFIRLGEDTEDCENRGQGFPDIYITRGISF